jgi:hypothetical protein
MTVLPEASPPLIFLLLWLSRVGTLMPTPPSTEIDRAFRGQNDQEIPVPRNDGPNSGLRADGAPTLTRPHSSVQSTIFPNPLVALASRPISKAFRLTKKRRSYVMLQPIRVYLILLATTFQIVVFAAAGNAQAKSQESFNILYTGRLLGYYRLPDRQSGTEKPINTGLPWCFDAHPTAMSAQAKVLSATLLSPQYKDPQRRILVGTGDNFALELLARVFDPPPIPIPAWPGQKTPPIFEYSKDQFNWDWKKGEDGRPKGWVLAGKDSPEEAYIVGHGLQVIPTDNVACFLAYAGYDAIVPGRHDFYYGPERVRSLARLLASIDGSQKDSLFHPTQMLAANLLIKSSWISGHSPVLDSQKPRLPFDVAHSATIAFPSDGSEVLPWLSRLKLGYTNIDHINVMLMGPEKDPDYDSLMIRPGQHGQSIQFRLEKEEKCWFFAGKDSQFANLPENCGTLKTSSKPPEEGEMAGLRCGTHEEQDSTPGAPKRSIQCNLTRVKPLLPGYYKLCFWIEGTDPKTNPPQCSRFSVATPFFQYPEPAAVLEKLPLEVKQLLPSYKNPSPYLIKKVCDDDGSGHDTNCKKVAIFGVVDPDLVQQVGEINSSWLVTKEPDHRLWDDTADPFDREHKVGIKVADAAKSLKQLLDYFTDCIDKKINSSRDFCYDDTNIDGHPALKVLLAQMSPEKANHLAAQLKNEYHFDVVITDHDPEQFTRDQITILDPTILPADKPDPEADCSTSSIPDKRPHCHVPSFIVVPPPAWDESWKADPARLLRVTKLQQARREYQIRGAAAATQAADVSLAKKAAPFFAKDLTKKDERNLCKDSKEACIELRTIATKVLHKVVGSAPPCTAGDCIEDLLRQATLAALLKKTHADVAMLQKIDFWFGGVTSRCLLGKAYLLENTGGEKPTTASSDCDERDENGEHWLQKALDIILWKGTTFIVLPVRGSVLQAVMKRSKDYNSADDSGLSPEDDQGRGLVTMGIDPDGNDYRVNDMPLDQNRLYTVVTTDYAAAGDTAYPEFNDAGVPSKPRPYFAKTFQYISSVVCEQYFGKNNQGLNNAPKCSSEVNTNAYYDNADLVEPKPPGGNTWQHQLWLWLPFHPSPGQKSPRGPAEQKQSTKSTAPNTNDASLNGKQSLTAKDNKKQPIPPGQWAQEYPIWKLSLDKGSVGFSVQRHSDSQADLNKTFGGVGSSQVLAPTSHFWNTDVQVTYLRSHSLFDFVFSPELLYAGTFTEVKQGGFRNPNQSADRLSLDSGFRIHFLPPKRHSHWSVDLGIHLETQPFAIVQSLSLPLSPLPLQFNLPRTNTRLGRLGVGRYDRKSYLQAGVEGGGQSGAFREFDFPGTPIICIPSATQSLQQCVNAKADGLLNPNSQVKVQQEFRYRSGVFWHSLLVVPAGQRVSASLENQGEFFFNNSGDNSTDTRLQHLMTAKISFPIWPMIAISPTYQFFYYENKLAYKSLWQQQALITIDYKFDWTNRGISRSQLRYKNSQSPQK